MSCARAFIRAGAVAFALSASPVVTAQVDPHTYTITNVSQAVPGMTVGWGGLSDTGFAAGWVVIAEPPYPMSSFRWSPAGTVVPDPPAGLEWLCHAGFDVNDSGTFVGTFGTQSPNMLDRGFRSRAGVTEELLTPSGLYAYPSAINDEGWIVGYGMGPVGVPGAVMWSPDLVPSYVANLTQAIDINDRNQVVGIFYDQFDVTTAFLVENGEAVRLGTLDPAKVGSVLPWAINNWGTVVGYSVIGPARHAFRWTEESGMTELPGLGYDVFPFDVAAVDINDHGWIVGYAPNATGQTPVIWSPDGTVTELGTIVPEIGIEKNWPLLAHVMKINAAGQILALASHKPSNHHARTVLLTPAALRAEPQPDAGGSVLEVTGAVPGRPVYLVAAAEDPFDTGYTPIPGGEPIGVCMDDPLPIAAALADGSGRALFRWQLPPALAAGAVRLQALQLKPCLVSNVVHVAP
ncbi:MAG TPA: hypothetical protein VFD43_05690 [Planctomycetota bacterium]|nr:hypothetical protein [Planctomycetota bacterium]